MLTSFTVEKLKFNSIHELPNSWNNQNYIDLLNLMEYGDISELPPEDLKEMCLLSLSDNDPEDAAKLVLEYIFKGRLTTGQIDNLSNEMLNEKMWEEYADLSLHEDFFNVNQLLYEAYNGKFPYPDAILFQVKVIGMTKESMSVFNNFSEAALIRLLVKGLPKNTLIYRLFEEQIEGDDFKDAKDIIWQLTLEKKNDKEIIFTGISSGYWFHDLKYVHAFQGTTHSDEV